MGDSQYLLATNENNENILHICAKNQVDNKLFDLIWENLLDVYNLKSVLMNMIDDEGNSPLEVSSRFDNEYMCQKLLVRITQMSLNDDALFRMRARAAHAASETGHLNILKAILRYNSGGESPNLSSDETKRILQIRGENRYTCLHLAAEQGEIASLFILC